MKLQLSYEIIFGYVQKLQIAHLVPLKTINIVSYDTFSKPQPGRAGPVFRLDQTNCISQSATNMYSTQNYYLNVG